MLELVLFFQVVILLSVVRLYLDHGERTKLERAHDVHLGVIRGILNKLVENQRMFVPMIDKMATVAGSVWESSHTREQVLQSHERQEAALANIERAVEKLEK